MREARVRGWVTKTTLLTLVGHLLLAATCSVAGTGCSSARRGAAAHPTTSAPAPEPVARPTRLVADGFSIAVLREDATLALWALGSARINPEREPVDALVDGWLGLAVLRGNLLTRVARAGEDGCWPQRVLVPEGSVAAVWHAGLYVLTATGALHFANLDEWPEFEGSEAVRAEGLCPAAPDTIAPHFAQVPGLRPVREILSVEGSLCGRDDVGGVFCLDPPGEASVASTSRPNGAEHIRFPLRRPAVALASANPGLCALDGGGTIHCMRPHDPASRETLPGGPYRRLAASQQQVCGQLTSGAVRCFRFPRMSTGYCAPGDCERSESSTHLPFGGHLMVTREDVCATTREGDLVCSCFCLPWRWPRCDPRPRKVASLHPIQPGDDALVDYDASTDRRCALGTSSGLRCWARGVDAQGDSVWRQERVQGPASPGTMEHVLVTERDVCVVLANRSMMCAAADALRDQTWERVASDVRDWQSGRGFVCALDDDQHVRCRGSIALESSRVALSLDPREPVTLGASPAQAAQLTAGDEHVCIRLVEGRVACLGDGASGQLGLGSGHLASPSLQVVPGLRDVHTIVASETFTLARSVSALHAWGDRGAYHPAPMEPTLGALHVLPLLGGDRLCAGGSEWRCGGELVRFLPWSERPHVTLDEGGKLPEDFSWSRGRARHLCNDDSHFAEATHCFTDAVPVPATRRLGEAVGIDRYQLPTTPDDLPRVPLRPVQHARFYQVDSETALGEPGCGSSLVSRSRWESDEACPNLAQRGRAISATDLETLLRTLNDVEAYEGSATCFLPHHEVIFFDAQDQPVGRLVVCLTCGTMVGVPPIPAQSAAGGNTFPPGLDLEGICQRAGLDDCIRSE